MRTLISCLTALVLAVVVTLPAAAQHEQHHPQQADTSRGMMPGGMMQGGMMQGGMTQDGMMDMMHGGMMQMHMQMMQQAMNDPLRRRTMLVHVLPTMQEPLGLSDEQVTDLQSAARQLEEEHRTHGEQMAQARQRLQDAMDSDEAAPGQVRSMLEEVALHHARMQAFAYETGVQMESILTDEQRSRLSEMAPMQLHQHMMMNMTMMEMMQAMHGAMGSGGMHAGMMPRGMMELMKGGMMRGGMMNRGQQRQ